MKRSFAIYLAVYCLIAIPVHGALNSALWKDRISSNDPAVRKTALDDLRALNKEEKGQAAAILGTVLHRGPVEAERAALGLAVLGPDAEPAIPDLVFALGYDEESVAVAVSSAIVPLGMHAVHSLQASLDDSNFFVRRRAVAILGKMGSSASSAADALVSMLNDPQYEVQAAAEIAIPQVGSAAIPALMRAYREADEPSRRRIVRLLSTFGLPASMSLRIIAKTDPSGFVRLSAIQGLSQLQPFPKEMLPIIMGGLADFDEGVRGGSADALGNVGAAAQPAVKALKRIASDDPDSLVRQKATDALTLIVSTETPKK